MIEAAELPEESATRVDMIPLCAIAESPSNPRKTFGDLSELTESVKACGVLQPILVRPDADGYELVFGHRRVRAARAAGLEQVPAMIRDLDDTQVLEAQIIENCHREDIHPLEEADSYRILHEEHGYEVEELAAKVGQSKSYIYARMKLCALGEEGRKAFIEGKLTASTALLVARIPNTELQVEATNDITRETEWSSPMSYRYAKEYVRRTYMLQLKGAPFSRKAEDLGAGACTTCPKRTGNQSELFEDVGSADVCTDPPCYQRKVDATWQKTAERYRKKGITVIDDPKEIKKIFPYGDNLAWNSGYVDLHDRCEDDPENRQYAKLLGKRAIGDMVLARDPDGKARQLFPNDKLVEALKAVGHDFSTSSSDEDGPEDPHETIDSEFEARLCNRVMERLVAAVEAREPDEAFWRACLADHDMIDCVIDRRQWNSDEYPGPEEIDARLAEITVPQLRGLVFETCVTGLVLPVWREEQRQKTSGFCARLGLDYEQIREELRQEEADTA